MRRSATWVLATCVAIGGVRQVSAGLTASITSGATAAIEAERDGRQRVTTPLACSAILGYESGYPIPGLGSFVILHEFDGNSLDDARIPVANDVFDDRTTAFAMSPDCTQAVATSSRVDGAVVVDVASQGIEVRETVTANNDYWLTADRRVASWRLLDVPVPVDPDSGQGTAFQPVIEIVNAETGDVFESFVQPGATPELYPARDESVYIGRDDIAFSARVFPAGAGALPIDVQFDHQVSGRIKVSPSGRRLAVLALEAQGDITTRVYDLDGSLRFSESLSGIAFETDDQVLICREAGAFRVNLNTGDERLIEAFDDYRLVDDGFGPPGMQSIRGRLCAAATF